MNIYTSLNNITNYIEEHLDEVIDYDILAEFMGVNTYTMQRIFSMLCGITLADYIRKRRLSNAGFDLYKKESKIIDIALKYQYGNATSFSRAFEKFHGIKPSYIDKYTKLKNYPQIIFDEKMNLISELEYEIISLEPLKLYGICTKTNNNTIFDDAPTFFKQTEEKYYATLGYIPYGMITYDISRCHTEKYYCLYREKKDKFEEINIPASKWLKFHIASQNPKDIQEISQKFYKEFLPSCRYNLREIPELEYYHDGTTDFLVAIY